jgi:hypothetical protein
VLSDVAAVSEAADAAAGAAVKEDVILLDISGVGADGC